LGGLGGLGGLKRSKGSMSSKGWGFSSADVGVFTNLQRGLGGLVCSRGWKYFPL